MIPRLPAPAASGDARLAHAARPDRLMTASSLVPVEGQLARPSLMPFSGLPFGREWTSLAGCPAQLRTVFIDPDAPHRACQWRPLRRTAPAGSTTAAPAASSVLIPTSGGPPRVLHALCCALGAFGLIGWLLWSHLPERAAPPAPSAPAATPAPPEARAGRPRPAAPPRHTSTAPLPPAGAPTHAPVSPVMPLPEASHARVKPARPVAIHTRPPLEHAMRHDAAAPHRTDPPVTAARSPDRHTRPAALDDPTTFAEWQTLYATLRADLPAALPAAAHRPPPDDWANALQHRRLTADPARFTR
jgi:hypothetical protein